MPSNAFKSGLTCALLSLLSACSNDSSSTDEPPRESGQNVSSETNANRDAAIEDKLERMRKIGTDYKPQISLALKKDPALEKRIKGLLDKMTLEQKVGQMVQVRIGQATPEEIAKYGVGSILNGGGQWPNDNRDATAKEWADYAETIYQASMNYPNSEVSIPIIWGTDAVHGHNNVRGAVLYPHNIGLGAANNPELVKKIAQATAASVAATGIDWNFAPSVAVARDYRWGRTYESFSENPEIVTELGAKVVEGLQGDPNSKSFLDQSRVIATAKHFIGDGGTGYGDDQGYTFGRQTKLLETHLPSYLSALESGVQTIMASYNFWNGKHSHANKALLTDLLKGELQFDGFIVSDWQAIPHIDGCTLDSCAESVIAGVDVFMIPNAPDWQNFHKNTVQQVKDGSIPLSRIDDAVTRILRVKMRAGLWDKPSPSKRELAGNNALIGASESRKIARQAVRESLVLLKNNGVLPINPTKKILVTGNAANNLSRQAGGWSLTWQGSDNKNEHYVGATSIFDGIAAAVADAGGKAILSTDDTSDEKVDVAIVVAGEDAYAEMYGDLQNLQTIEFEQDNKQTLQLIQKLKAKGIPTVLVFISGRPMWVNKELNAADAFVAAWLPGSEGQGIADVILSDKSGEVKHDFKGRLSFTWPKDACDGAVNFDDFNYKPLFKLGYGLTYNNTNPNWRQLDETDNQFPLGCRILGKTPVANEFAFNSENNWYFTIERNSLERVDVTRSVTLGAINAKPHPDKPDTVVAEWDGSEEGRLDLRNGNNKNDFLSSLAHNGSVTFDIKLESLGKEPLQAALYSGHLTGTTIDVNKLFSEKTTPGSWTTLSIDLRCFTNIRADMNKVSIPFGLHSKGKHKLALGNVRYVPNSAEKADMSCPAT